MNIIIGGMLLLELNRVLRPGGYFVWSATPVYQKLEEDVEIWKGTCVHTHTHTHTHTHIYIYETSLFT